MTAMRKFFFPTAFAKFFAVIVALALLNAEPKTTADSELSRATLKGLSGVYVGVEYFDEHNKAADFDKRTFQTDVELKLRLTGIKVLAEEEQLATPGMPILYLHVNALHKQPGQKSRLQHFLEIATNGLPCP